jgi:hypothetical protein
MLCPTNSCFDDALSFLFQRMNELRLDKHTDRLKLVHGTMLAPTGELISHAWVEEGGQYVWDHGKLHPQLDEKVVWGSELETYYQSMKVQDVTKYSILQVLEQNKKHLNFGPWEERYRELCIGELG